MGTVYTIQLPDGEEIDVEGPDDATDEQVHAFAQETLRKAKPDVRYQTAVQRTGTGVDALRRTDPVKADLTSTLMQGGTFGFSDEIAGVGGALVDAVQSPFRSDVDFNPAASYAAYRDRERERVSATRKAYPWLSTGMEVGGGLMTGGAAATGAFAGAGTASMAQAARQGAKLGAISGAASGAGYGEGFNNSVAAAGLGGALGAGVGAALPVGAGLLGKSYTAARNYLQPQNGMGRDLVSRAMRQDAIAPSQAAAALTASQQRGVPLGLMDLGENLRGLTGGVSRAPGAGRRLVREAVNTRQMAQGERVRGAIERDLGPIENVADQSDALLARARSESRPLYDAAYAQDVTLTPEMIQMLETPAGRRALGKARETMANDRVDPTRMGIEVGEDGQPFMAAVPSLRTMDYVKGALDDIVEEYRDPVTQRLSLDRQGNSVNGVLRDMLGSLDNQVPIYAQARAAYAGPAGERTALQTGTAFPRMSAEEIERAQRAMSPTQQAQAALGYRSQLATDLDRRVVGGDKVNVLIGTPRKQGAIGQVFGKNGNFPRFAETLGDESMANETYRQIMTGSQTANKLADDAGVADTSLFEDMAGKAVKGASNGGLAGIFAEGLNALRDTSRFGAGATGQRAREEAAALLSETDPVALAEAMRQALRQSAGRRVSERSGRRRAVRAGMFGARAAGGISSYALRPVDE